MTYSDCDPDRPTTPESRLRDALEDDVARHLSEVRAGFEADREALQRVISNDPWREAWHREIISYAMNSQHPSPCAKRFGAIGW